MQITHNGHACLYVEAADARVLIDPGVFSHGFEELRDLDAIFITHSHWDHLDAERLTVLLEANDSATLYTEPETAAQVRKAGLEPTVLRAGESVQVKGVRVNGVGGDHATIHPDVPQIGNVGLVFRASGEPTLFHPGDAYGAVPEGIELLALPVVAPWASLRDTVDFARAVKAGLTFPIHDALLAEPGRQVYHGMTGQMLGGVTEFRVIAGEGPIKF
jgi:L-ascorbate metabolism protein UlaG (beta-lactamase superfamily)